MSWMIFWGDLVIAGIFFGLGYFVNGHPDATASFLTKLAGVPGRLFAKLHKGG